MQIVSLNLLSYIISIVVNLGLGFWVFTQDRKNKINKYFLLFIASVVLWLISLFVFYNFHTPDWILLIGRFNFTTVIVLQFFALEFVLVFPLENFVIKKWIQYLIIIENTALFLTTLFTPLVDQNEVASGLSRVTSYGPLYYLYILHFIIFATLIIWILIKKSSLSSEEDKMRIYYVIIGFLVFAIFGFLTNILIPLFGYQGAANLGPLCTLFLLFALSYAIIKHHLFNVKIIVAELLVFTLWITLLINTSLSIGSRDFPLNTIILISVVAIGIFLIKGVIKEVEQKEEIEKIEKELEKAYAVEKKANEELAALDKVKNQFLMQTQHDLRTPLSTIKGYCELLLSGTFGKQSKKTMDVAKRIYIVAEDKIRDVNNFLDVTQFQLGKKVVTLNPGVELDAILDEVFSQLEPGAKGKGIFLKLEKSEEKLVVSADREKLKSAIFNVVDNCIKYTPNGGVTISVKYQKSNIENGSTAKDKILIMVQDTGIGIPKEKIATLFDTAFERGEKAKKTFATGRGIGLYLSSQIIKAHDGKIWAESEGEGKGSTFFIELPVGQ